MADIPNRLQVATEPTQLEIKTNVENVNKNVTSVKNDVTTVNNNVATVNSNLGPPTSGANNSTSANAHAKLNWLLSNLNTLVSGRVVRSVQRGKGSSYGYSGYTIPISSVNTSKSLLIINGTARVETNGADVYVINLENDAYLNSSNISFQSLNYSSIRSISVDCAWQVIEFY